MEIILGVPVPEKRPLGNVGKYPALAIQMIETARATGTSASVSFAKKNQAQGLYAILKAKIAELGVEGEVVTRIVVEEETKKVRVWFVPK